MVFTLRRLTPSRTIELDNTPYNVYHFDEPLWLENFFSYLNEMWIEGIGSIHGPLFPHKKPRRFSNEVPMTGDSLILTCSYANGQG